MTTTDARYVGIIAELAYADGGRGFLAGATATVGYLGTDGGIITPDADGEARRIAARFATSDEARAAVAAAHPGAIPDASRLRDRELRS